MPISPTLVTGPVHWSWTYSNFDVHPDGKRFAVLKAPATGETSLSTKSASSLIFRRAPPQSPPEELMPCTFPAFAGHG